MSQQQEKNYFDCDYYHYFTGERPVMSANDSIKSITYAMRIGSKDAFPLDHYSRIKKPLFDTVWYDKLYSNLDDSSIHFRSLDISELAGLVTSHAVIIGKVIDMRYEKDSTKCLHYKLNYVIQVQEVLHSYFNLSKDDLVLIKESNFGYAGGCLPDGNSRYMTTSELTLYKDGEINVFLLDKYRYEMTFLLFPRWKKAWGKNYDDVYCPNAFELLSHYDFNTENKLSDVKLFFNTKFKEHGLNANK